MNYIYAGILVILALIFLLLVAIVGLVVFGAFGFGWGIIYTVSSIIILNWIFDKI